MPKHLFIIEAPGKRKMLAHVLRQSGLFDVEVMATVGHLGANPEGFNPLAVDGEYRETQYHLKPDRVRLAAEIGEVAEKSTHIYLASDDDQEGDVIARDILRFCLPDALHDKVRRVRLRALSPGEVRQALDNAAPIEPLAAARGDARRTLDRLIGSLSNERGAVGRVQGSALRLLSTQRPVVGVATHTLACADGGAPFVAQAPVYAGSPKPITFGANADEVTVRVGSRETGVLATQALNHDEIVLSASLVTGAEPAAIGKAMQGLYERGKMSYPRAKDHGITPDALRRLQAIARTHGAAFDPGLVTAVREADGAYAHEAPNPLVFDLPLNRALALMTLEDQVLVHLTRNLLDVGMAATVERPLMADLAALPREAQCLNWCRVTPAARRLWVEKAPVAGIKLWTKPQSLLHFMSHHGLGRPSTILNHVDKFLNRGLVTEDFDLTRVGHEWCNQIIELFGHQNISAMIENYIDQHCDAPEFMVAEMVKLCGLSAVETTVRDNNPYDLDENRNEATEITAGAFPGD